MRKHLKRMQNDEEILTIFWNLCQISIEKSLSENNLGQRKIKLQFFGVLDKNNFLPKCWGMMVGGVYITHWLPCCLIFLSATNKDECSLKNSPFVLKIEVSIPRLILHCGSWFTQNSSNASKIPPLYPKGM